MSTRRSQARIQRLIRILTLILSSSGWGPKRLAEVCGVTVRTIHRDMKDLKAAGIPWFFDSGARSYALPEEFRMPPLRLTDGEALALSLLAEAIEGADESRCLREARQGLAKVLAGLSCDARRRVARAAAPIERDVARAAMNGKGIGKVSEILAAIGGRRRLRCAYKCLNREQLREFDFEPHALLYAGGTWHAVGRAIGRRDRADLSCLSLGRFASITPTDETYEPMDIFSLITPDEPHWEAR